MNDDRWSSGFGSGLLIGLVFSIFFVIFLDVSSPTVDRRSVATGECDVSMSQCSSENTDQTDRLFWLRKVFDPKDTIAQWIIMIFAIYAASLLLKTLNETKEMAKLAKKTADDQAISFERSITAAAEANTVAARQLRAHSKPWIDVEYIGPLLGKKWAEAIAPFSVEEVTRLVFLYGDIRVKNIGSMPANTYMMNLQVMSGDDWPYVPNMQWNPAPGNGRGNTHSFFCVLPAGGSVVLGKTSGVISDDDILSRSIELLNITNDERVKLISNPPPIFGHIDYADTMGARYRHHFAFRVPAYKTKSERFGGISMNKEEPLDD